MVQYLWLVPLGLVVGAYGTLIGAGGGFVLVPVLLLLYPDESPQLITTISLAVVFFNSLSGSLAYGRMGHIDYRSGLLFASTAVPGAVLGALTTSYLPRGLFDLIFALFMLISSVFLILRSGGRGKDGKRVSGRHISRRLVNTDGIEYVFSYNPVTGMVMSFFIGYISSLLGIGGGIVQVPTLIHLLNFPVPIATATSQFVLAIMSLTGTGVHAAAGVFVHGIRRTIALAIGVLLGAQFGAWLSRRLNEEWIIRSLAIALGFVGVRILLNAL
ncbi:MAG: sulfite exporter TauE/SafE family protein [Chloroflexi bacterium]|nr:sulfite exporter TauE/SafE family protein [Chloroflexota bacterium]